MNEKLTYGEAIEKTSHEEYREVEMQLADAVAELNAIYEVDPSKVPDDLVQMITELQKRSSVLLQDWLDSMDLE
jgi:hypothetical protein